MEDKFYLLASFEYAADVQELKYIMEELRPKTIVVRKGRRVFDKKEYEENEYINAYLSKHYRVQAVVEKAEILQRLQGF